MINVNQSLWVKLEEPLIGNTLRCSTDIICIPLSETKNLLINGLTGAIDICNTREYNDLLDFETKSSFRPFEIKKLVSRGYLVSDEIFQNVTEKIERQVNEIANSSTVFVFISATDKCPMGCQYCIEGNRPANADHEKLTVERINSVFSFLEKSELKSRDISLVLFGGEPLQPFLKKEIEYLFEKISSSDLKIHTFTNGIYLNEFIDLFEATDHILSGVTITIDGRENYHDSQRRFKNAYATAIEAISLLKNSKIPIVIRSNISLSNLNEIAFLKRIYQDEGWWDNPNFSFELTQQTTM